VGASDRSNTFVRAESRVSEQNHREQLAQPVIDQCRLLGLYEAVEETDHVSVVHREKKCRFNDGSKLRRVDCEGLDAMANDLDACRQDLTMITGLGGRRGIEDLLDKLN
jgi:hypothetical protein